MGGLHPVVVFWTGWGIHVTVLVSFMVQVTLLLLADIRRRKDWTWLKVVIWSAYTLADTTAIYALGHMSVLCNWWSPEHQLMALWAPLLLVHLGGQDNITAYAMEDNRLWVRHLQTCVLQVAAAVYVLYVSSILSHPMSSKLRLAAILMFVVGVLKYGERIYALMRADSCCSSSLSPTNYDKARSVGTAAGDESNLAIRATINERNRHLILVAYSLLDVPKQMFEGPTTYVKISSNVEYDAEYMLDVVKMQVSMMYDLLYTKAAVVHTWYGLCSRVLISLPFTVTALTLFRSLLSHNHSYRRVDVSVTNVLLIGAVVLEIMSVLRAIFSKWTAVLLYDKQWYTNMALLVGIIAKVLVELAKVLVELICYICCCCCYCCCCCFSCCTSCSEMSRMRQLNLFALRSYRHSKYSLCRKLAKRMGLEDWWDSNVYSWSTDVPELVITRVLELVSSTTIEEITKSCGQNAVRRTLNNNDVADWIWMEPEMKLEDRILVWHIATHVYTCWYGSNVGWGVGKAAMVLADYMFFLLAARPYMLPYPVSRQAYAQLCTHADTHLSCGLNDAVLNQKDALMQGTPLQPDLGIGRRQTGGAAAQRQPHSMNSILDKGCQLAAKLIHITAKKPEESVHVKGIVIKEQEESTVRGNGIITEQAAETTFSVIGEAVLNMVLEVWVEMLCYTAYKCNENSHAKHLTDGGEIMTIIALLMIYKKKGLCSENTTSGTAVGPSFSQGAGAGASSSQTTATDIESG